MRIQRALGPFYLLVEAPGSTSRSTAPGVALTAAEIASMTCIQTHSLIISTFMYPFKLPVSRGPQRN